MEIAKAGSDLLWTTFRTMANGIPIIFSPVIPLYLSILFSVYFASSMNSLVFSVVGLVVVLMLISWLSITWHRHLIFNDIRGKLLVWNGYRIVKYLKALIKVSLIVLSIFGAVILLQVYLQKALIYFLPDFTLNNANLVFGFVAYTVSSYFSLRLGLALPAAAFDRTLSIIESYHLSRPVHIELMITSTILTVFSFLTEEGLAWIGFETLWAHLLMRVSDWFGFMFGLTMLTVLYRRLVDKGPHRQI